MPIIKLSKDHEYTVDGVPAPGVSDILDVFFPPTPFYTEEGRENGTTRHQWFAFLSQGFEPEHEPHEDIVGAVNGYKAFLANVKPEYVSGEIPYYHPTLKFCGTPDVVFKIGQKMPLVDYKPKNKTKRTRIQTAFYYLLLRANGVMVNERYELRLYDGIYRFEKHEDSQDMRRAEIMIAAYWAAQFYK